MKPLQFSFYATYIKRLFDIIFSLALIIILAPFMITLTIVSVVVMKGNPFFIQLRPGKDEKIFKLIKFRTMTNDKDKNGNYLSDEKRLVPYGKFLRSTSLDELPELINILKGDMSFVGPRPLLVQYLSRYNEEQARRHEVRPGITGLAQVNGRNAITWDQKFKYDINYVDTMSFCVDLKIIVKTIFTVIRREGISSGTAETMEEFMGNKKENIIPLDKKNDNGFRKKMDIVIIASFCGTLDRKTNSRFVYIANMLSKYHNVEIITSDFNHGSKEHFSYNGEYENLKITMIHEPGYKKNICIKRFVSHYYWGKLVSRYLIKRKTPDIIYCAIPTLTAASKAAKYSKHNNVKFIVDIQDLWPEAFSMVFNVPVVSKLAFYPFKRIADYAYSNADAICAVSDTYMQRAISVNRKYKDAKCVYLGTDLMAFDRNVNEFLLSSGAQKYLSLKEKDEIWLGYCGTLGSSYDLLCVFDALEIVNEKNYKAPKFIIMGDGPRAEEFKNYAKKKNLDVLFTGNLPYQEMCGVLCLCDITINPISKGAAASIINKHADYAASGLPVLNLQESEEYRKLVDNYEMGINCNNGDCNDLAEKMIILLNDKCSRTKMGNNSRKCAEERFDRIKTYNKIVDMIIE